MPNVYEIVTERIIAQLEKGCVPWRRPWKTELPCNLVSGKPYRGLNVFLLASQGFGSRYWLTFAQCQKLGGQVMKGEDQPDGTVVFIFTPSAMPAGDELFIGNLSPAQLAVTHGQPGSVERLVPTGVPLTCTTQAPLPHSRQSQPVPHPAVRSETPGRQSAAARRDNSRPAG